MADYDAFNPDKSRTDPLGLHKNSQFPAHVFKWAGADVPNDYIVVKDAAEKKAALADGWAELPVADAPKEPKGKEPKEPKGKD